MKRIMALLLALALCAGCCASLAEEAAESKILTGEELEAYAESIRTLALQGEMLNDPADEDALSEDGYALIYTFATLYADRPEITEETKIRTIVLTDGTAAGPRGANLDMGASELLTLFECGNPSLDGSRERALIYLQGDAEQGFSYGLARRDGQRLQQVEYGEMMPAGKAYRYSSLVFSIQSDLVTGIRVDGLNQETHAAAALSLYEELSEAAQESGYTRVPVSRNGLELEAFSEADLSFSGLNYLALQPDSFGGQPEDTIMEDEENTWLRIVDGEGYSAVFSCDRDGNHAVISSYTILSDALEGPRGVRLGDMFHEDYSRFRSGENETDGITELLYGQEGTAPWGLASYAEEDGGLTLRYITGTADGRTVELYLHYLQSELTEIILHTLSEDSDHVS